MTTPNELPPPVAGDETRDEMGSGGRVIAWWMGRLNDYDTDVGDWRSTCDEAAAEVIRRAALRPAPETPQGCELCGDTKRITVYCDGTRANDKYAPCPKCTAPEAAAPVAWDVVSHAGNRVSGPHGKQEAAEHHALRLRSEIGTATVRPLYAAPPAPASGPDDFTNGDLVAAANWLADHLDDDTMSVETKVREVLRRAPASGEQRADVTDEDIAWFDRHTKSMSAQMESHGHIQAIRYALAALRARQGESREG